MVPIVIVDDVFYYLSLLLLFMMYLLSLLDSQRFFDLQHCARFCVPSLIPWLPNNASSRIIITLNK